jgi:hypothetical protein
MLVNCDLSMFLPAPFRVRYPPGNLRPILWAPSSGAVLERLAHGVQ